MAKYRPIDTRVWNDRKFLSLSEESRLLWLFLMTTPFTLPIPGVIVAGDHALAEQLGWSVERFRERFREVQQKGLAASREGSLIWLRNALRYQPPANPNVIKGWSKSWDDIPECSLKHEVWQALRIACKSWDRTFAKQFAEPLRERFPDPSSNGSGNGSANGIGNGFIQEQEQEQEQDRERSPLPPEPTYPQAKNGRSEPARPDQIKAHAALVSWAMAEVDAIRTRVASRFGWTDVRPLHPMDAGRGHLLERIAEDPARAEDNIRHVLAVAEAEAVSKKTVEWLTGAMFKFESWRKKLGMRIEDARRAPPSAPSASSPTMRIAGYDDDAPPPLMPVAGGKS